MNESEADPRPRVLIADDHVSILAAALSLLQQRFDVVSTVTDGKAAVQATMDLCPDLVILDIAMPVLDGMQVAHELKSLGSRAKVVFLTMQMEEDNIVSGLASGGRAYVLKTRMASDLVSALERVLRGRMFISPTFPADDQIPRWWPNGTCRHSLQFYSDDDFLLDGLGELIASALQAGDGVCVNATEAHREGLARRVESHGLSVSASIRLGQYVAFDASETLSLFMSGDKLDVARCASTFRTMARSARGTSQRQPSRIAIYAESAALARAQGRADLALQLEQVWSDVTATGSVFCICGYPLESSRVAEERGVFPEISKEHCVII